MPPAVVKSIRDLIFWQYAKLISKSAGFGIQGRAFQMKKFIELRDEKIKWSNSIREYVKEHESPKRCIYCGSSEKLTTEHVLPRCRNGPDSTDNAVRICKNCNSNKGKKRLYEWFGLKNKDKVPRIAEGKYLKLLYTLHKNLGTLDVKNVKLLCPKCDMSGLCKKEGCEGKLTAYCLEGPFKKK